MKMGQMKTFNEYIKIYQKSLQQGDIKAAYNRLMEYFTEVRLYLKSKHPAYKVANHIYEGRMDISFFSCSPQTLKREKLRIIIVFIHDAMQFDIWLVGQNKNVQAKFWKIFKESDWDEYRIPTSIKEVYSIVEHTLVKNPDFDNSATLTRQIEQEAIRFIADMEDVFVQ